MLVHFSICACHLCEGSTLIFLSRSNVIPCPFNRMPRQYLHRNGRPQHKCQFFHGAMDTHSYPLPFEAIDRSFKIDFETFKTGWLKMFEGKSEDLQLQIIIVHMKGLQVHCLSNISARVGWYA